MHPQTADFVTHGPGNNRDRIKIHKRKETFQTPVLASSLHLPLPFPDMKSFSLLQRTFLFYCHSRRAQKTLTVWYAQKHFLPSPHPKLATEFSPPFHVIFCGEERESHMCRNIRHCTDTLTPPEILFLFSSLFPYPRRRSRQCCYQTFFLSSFSLVMW